MSTTNISINQLPITDEIVNGDYLIVDNGIETKRVDFKDFIVGLDNVTFASTISSNSSDISSLSSTFYSQTPIVASLSATTHYIKIKIGNTNYAIMLSATG